MPYDPQKHHRRSIRLKGYDYTQPGAYYVTICTAARQCLFGQVVKGEMQLNLLGCIAKFFWLQIPAHFPHIQLDTYVIMPDHLHGILVIVDDTIVGTRHCRVSTKEQFCQPIRGSIPTAIRSFKGAVTKQIHGFFETTEVPIWQSSFYESIIRAQADLNSCRQYIIENPQRWEHNPRKLEHQKNHPILLDLPF